MRIVTRYRIAALLFASLLLLAGCALAPTPEPTAQPPDHLLDLPVQARSLCPA